MWFWYVISHGSSDGGDRSPPYSTSPKLRTDPRFATRACRGRARAAAARAGHGDPRRLAVRRAHVRNRAARSTGAAASATCSRTGSWTSPSSSMPFGESGAGGTALDPEVVAQLFSGRRQGPREPADPREREVLGLMADGRSNAGIARRSSSPRRGREARRQHLRQARAPAFRKATTGASSPCSRTLQDRGGGEE